MKGLQALCCVFILLLSIDQLTAQSAQIISDADDGRWLDFNSNYRGSSAALLDMITATYGLGEDVGFEPLNASRHPRTGTSTTKYQQTYRGLPIEGAIYHIHRQSDRIRSNGHLVKNVRGRPQARIGAQEAISKALLHIDAAKYAWQDPHKERMIKTIEGDEAATFYPTPELVFAHEDYASDGSAYRLAWKMEIYAEFPAITEEVFVDAETGEILYTLSTCQHVAVPAIGATRYSGIQSFTADSLAADTFRLYDETRGGGIHTLDMNNTSTSDLSLATEFVNNDNYWDLANQRFSDAAIDVHWGMQGTYDYFHDVHGWSSYDGQSAPIISYVHVNSNWFNARWTGRWSEFGDGNNNPLTSVDVVSHELTHGVTGNSADLIYQNESGALNESFSDIFGNLVEYYLKPDSFSWNIGEQNFTLRSMSNPNQFEDPDTYQGDFWWTESGNNGGVHTNSGVQNFWFYLLSEGGQGINDFGDAFAVDGLGLDKAAAIAFRNLTTYLTPSSQYQDARQGAIWSAEDLYGSCSEEVLQTIRAWHAVGIGPDAPLLDIHVDALVSPVSANCQFGDQEDVAVRLLYPRTGCDQPIEEGTAIPLTLVITKAPEDDTMLLATDTLILSAQWWPGDTIDYAFSSVVADLSTASFYDLNVHVQYAGDERQDNDVSSFSAASILTIDETTNIGFETFGRPVVPDHWLLAHPSSTIQISSLAESIGFRGLLISGDEDRNPDRDLLQPASDDDIFSNHPEYNASMCMCVDASPYTTIELSFDIQQGVSLVHDIRSDRLTAPELAVGTRITIDGSPIGSTYHPDPLSAPSFRQEVVDLSAFAGSSFELCFEGKHFFHWRQDFLSTTGDYTYLDDIQLTMDSEVSSTEADRADDGTLFFPNPVNDLLRWRIPHQGPKSLQLFDIEGNLVRAWPSEATEGDLRVSDLSAGVYFLRVNRSGQPPLVQRVLVMR